MPKDTKIKQAYRAAWESLPDFKGWLQPVPGEPSRAFCRVCNKTLYAHRLSLLQHTSTVKHSKRSQLKFIENEQQKSDVVQSDIVTVEVVPGNVNLNNFDGADINSSEDETPNMYINTVSQPQQENINIANNAKACVQQIEDLPPISTHVLDSSRGLPVQNLQVSLYKLMDGRWTHISDCVTNPVGRCGEFIPRENFKAGRFKLHFDVDRYFVLRKQDSIYPFIEIVFDVHSPLEHYHIPLVLSPFGYSTYKGS